MYSVGSVITSPAVGILTTCFPYFYILLIGILGHITSNFLYGLAPYAWLTLVARFLLGASFKVFKIVALTYVGNKESQYDDAYREHKEKKIEQQYYINGEEKVALKESTNIKKTVLILISFVTYVPSLFGPGNSYCVKLCVCHLSM